MATKINCDCCGVELTREFVFRFSCKRVLWLIASHQISEVPSIERGYVTEFNGGLIDDSGDCSPIDLCPKCYNKVLMPAVIKLMEMKNTFEEQHKQDMEMINPLA